MQKYGTLYTFSNIIGTKNEPNQFTKKKLNIQALNTFFTWEFKNFDFSSLYVHDVF